MIRICSLCHTRLLQASGSKALQINPHDGIQSGDASSIAASRYGGISWFEDEEAMQP